MRLPDNIELILRNKKSNFPYQTKWVEIDPMLLLKSSLDSKDLFEEKNFKRITFFQYLTLILDHEAALYIKDAFFGYDSEFIDLNAFAAINMFEKDLFNNESHYYILKNGMSQLVKLLEKTIMMSNTVIKHSIIVTQINDNHIITNKKEMFYFKHLICAIPQSSLNRFSIFANPLTQSVKQCPLLRIYAKYPKDNVWFKNINRTITDNYIRHIIPIDPQSGLIMTSYTDGKLTEYWNSYHSLGEGISY